MSKPNPSVFSTVRQASLVGLTSLSALLWAAPNALAQEAGAETRSAQECYEQKDHGCLEALYEGIVDNPSEEKSKAMFLLGQLKLDEGEDLVAAKDQFMMSIMFAEGYKEQALEKMNELYDAGNVEFETSECTVIKNEDCFHRIIEQSDDPKKVSNAQYLLGRRILDRDAEKSFELFTRATEAGHSSAECELAQFYEDDGLSVPEDYQKFINISLECFRKVPFKKFSKKYFAKYEKADGHKAYAHSNTGYYFFMSKMADPGYAATLAKKYCETYANKKPEGFECNVINMDGLWVKEAEYKALPETFSGVEDLIKKSAVDAFEGEYSDYKTEKVFVQSWTGGWSWKARGENSDTTLEELTTRALESCDKRYKEELDNRCVVVNVNGKWVDE